MHIYEALLSLHPTASFVINGEGYSDLNWMDESITKPTEAAINEEITKLTAAEPMRRLRVERNRRLAETDWWAVSDITISDERKNYRQALRDLPSTQTPENDDDGAYGLKASTVTWPTKPA